MTSQELAQFDEILNGNAFQVRPRLMAWRKGLTVTEEPVKVKKKQISQAQRGAIHEYLSQVAHEANNQGLTLQDMVKMVKKLEIRPTTGNLKETFLKPYIASAYGLESSENMSNQQIDETYDALNKVFGYYWHIYIPFPSDENRAMEELSGVRLGAHNNKEKMDYPEQDESTLADKF